jgi:hypothetical protein
MGQIQREEGMGLGTGSGYGLREDKVDYKGKGKDKAWDLEQGRVEEVYGVSGRYPPTNEEEEEEKRVQEVSAGGWRHGSSRILADPIRRTSLVWQRAIWRGVAPRDSPARSPLRRRPIPARCNGKLQSLGIPSGSGAP